MGEEVMLVSGDKRQKKLLLYKMVCWKEDKEANVATAKGEK